MRRAANKVAQVLQERIAKRLPNASRRTLAVIREETQGI
jgi:hypothetical protein